MSFSRKIAVGYLFLYGLLCLLNIPLVRGPLLEHLRSEYSSIAWLSDPHPVAHWFLCTAALVSAIGILRKKQWALWLAASVLITEIPFSMHILADSMWYSQSGTTGSFPFHAIASSPDGPRLRILAGAFLGALSFNAFFLLLLNPWFRTKTTYTPPSKMKLLRKRATLRNRLLWGCLAVFFVSAWLGQHEPDIHAKEQKIPLPSAKQPMSQQDLQKMQEDLDRKIKELERKNAQLSKQILEDSIHMELFVNSPESDHMLDQYGDDLASALPMLKSMLKGQKNSARSAVICLGEMALDNPANTEMAIPLLQNTLFHSERAVQTLAAVMLIRLDQKEKPIRLLQQTLTTHPDKEVLLFAIGGLMEAEISVDEPAILEVLTQSVNHPEPTIALFSARTLINSKQYDVVIPPMLKMIKHPQRDFRYFAAVMFWIMGPNARVALPSLESARLTETDSKVSIALMLAAASMKGN